MKYKPVFQELEEQVAWRRDKNHPLNKLMAKYSDKLYVENAATICLETTAPDKPTEIPTKKRDTSFIPNYDWIGL